MKERPRPEAAPRFPTRGSGLGLLAAIVAFLAVWLPYQRLDTEPAEAVAPPFSDDSLSNERFRPDAFYLPNDPLFGFVEIPAGRFLMGSDPRVDSQAFENERWSLERFQGNVELPAYYIGRYEVTVRQFRAFVEATGYAADPQSLRGAADHPVRYVSWTDALAYARWLEEELQESLETPAWLKALLGGGWRLSLPGEAQWEKAARGTDGRVYPWGNVPDDSLANYRGGATTAVGSFQCSRCAFSIDDMSGNVWELTRSPYQPYPFDPSDDWDDLDAEALFVMRGGSFQDAGNNVRAAVRGGVDPGARRPFIGFRIVLAQE